MALLKVQSDWIKNAPGRELNPDKAHGLQCKDAADDYCNAIFNGKTWVETIRPGNGADVFANASTTYFDKIRNDWNNPTQLPQPGDIINWGWSAAVPEGHVGIVVLATKDGVWVIEQDGYAQVPARKKFQPWVLATGAKVVGWLRPKRSKMRPDPKKTAVKKTAAKKKTYVTLPASAKVWGIYRPGVQPVSKNIFHYLTPSSYGGLTYEVKGWTVRNAVALIDTGVKGRVQIFVGNGSGARIFTK